LDEDSNQLVIQRVGYEYITKIAIPKSDPIHLAVTLENQMAKVYLNGILSSSGSFIEGPKATGRVLLGSSSVSGSDSNFDGYMDEMWFSNQARSPRWIHLLYENQKPNSSLVTVGPAFLR
jgi:hypothetical protein